VAAPHGKTNWGMTAPMPWQLQVQLPMHLRLTWSLANHLFEARELSGEGHEALEAREAAGGLRGHASIVQPIRAPKVLPISGVPARGGRSAQQRTNGAVEKLSCQGWSLSAKSG